MPIAFKFLAQSGGCGAGAEKFLAKVLRVSCHRLFCKSSFPTPRPGNLIHIHAAVAVDDEPHTDDADSDDDAEVRVMKT